MKLRSLLLCVTVFVMSAGGVLAQVTSNQIYQGLISYWPMDTLVTNDITGAITTPDVVSGLNLYAIGGATLATGEFSNGVALDGLTQYLVSTNTSPDGGNTNNLATGLPYYDGQPLTIACWVNIPQPTSATRYVWAMGSTTNNNILYLVQTGNSTTTETNLDCIIRNQNGTAVVNHSKTTNSLFNGNWHHLAWVDSNGVVSVYQDGVLENSSIVFSYWPDYLISPNAESGSDTFLYQMPINTFSLGTLVRAAVATPTTTGTYDDVAVWDRALSQEEIQYVMTNSIAQPVPALKPSFAVPWVGQTNAMGDYVVLNANAVGTPPLNLQWYENGSAIPDATNETLDLPYYNNTMTNSGTNVFYVVASNPNGTVTNGPGNLVVLPDATPQLSLGCYGYWPLDNVSNVTATNATTPDVYSVNNLNLTNVTAANLVPGVFDNALSFTNADAQNAYLDGINPAFNYTNYTISFWINANPGANGQYNDFMLDNASDASATPVLGFCSPQTAAGPSTNLCVYLRSDQSISQLPDVLSSNSVLDGTWHHVAWVDKGGSVTLYVDGNMDPVSFAYIRTNGTPTLRSNLTWTLNSEALGALWRTYAGADLLTCEMDDVAWWDRALSYTEVQYLQSNTVPLPTVLTAPSVLILPPTSFTNAYVGDADTISASVVGTQPISFQWYYSSTTNYTGSKIPVASNPSSQTTSLTLANLQATNTGFYYLIASNGAALGSGQSGGGMATSAVVQVVVHSYVPPPTRTNSIVLMLEFNAVADPQDVQPGFNSMNLNSGPTVFNGTTKVTISPLDGAVLTDRDRLGLIVNTPPAFTTAALYNSFIFSDVENEVGTGIDMLIQHLAPNTTYGVNIWSFDLDSTGVRVSDWTEAISGTSIINQYNFNGGNGQPTADYQDTFGALLSSDPNGQLDIQGISDPSYLSDFDVFLNAVVITANPVPQIVSSGINPADGNLLIVTQAQYSGQTSIVVQESPDLINWQNETDAVITTQNGPIYSFEFPLSATQMYYRVVYQPLGPQ